MQRGALFIREAAIHWDDVPRGSYLRDIPALKDFYRLVFDSNVTFFAGENGTGKSTLLEGIAVAYGYNPEGGYEKLPLQYLSRCVGAGGSHSPGKGVSQAQLWVLLPRGELFQCCDSYQTTIQ